MPFATTNLRPSVSGNRKVLEGDWTGSAGDDVGTITLSGGRVYVSRFENQDADDNKELPLVDVSVSGSTITVTVHNHMDVTNGRFSLTYA